MKKGILWLLVLALCAGLLGVGVLADFTDAGQITRKQAVEELVALGVFEGLDDGSFDPAGSLTRAQACQALARLVNGGTLPGDPAGQAFTDVAPGHWAYAAVGDCAARGIAAGVGNNCFDPDGTLTTAQCAKLLLVTAGYNARQSGLTGPGWKDTAMELAEQLGLLDGLEDAAWDAALCREDFCQMAYNCLGLSYGGVTGGETVRQTYFAETEQPDQPADPQEPELPEQTEEPEGYIKNTINIYGYVTSEPYQVRYNGNSCWSYTAWTAGGALQVLESGRVAARNQGDLVCLASENDGTYRDMTGGEFVPVAVTGYSQADGLVTLRRTDGTYLLEGKMLPERTVILNVDSARHIGVAGTELDVAAQDDTGAADINAWARYDGASRLCIVYDINNHWDGAGVSVAP